MRGSQDSSRPWDTYSVPDIPTAGGLAAVPHLRGRPRDSMAKMWSLQMPDYSEISENVWTNSPLYNNRIMSLVKKSLLDETTCPEISERSSFFLFCLIEGEADAI